VVTEAGDPVQGAEVGVVPCFSGEAGTTCGSGQGAQENQAGGRSAGLKATRRDVRVEGDARLQTFYPHPVRDRTTIRVALDEESRVLLQVETLDGEVADELFEGTLERGVRSLQWAPSQSSDDALGDGLYQIRFRASQNENTVADTTAPALLLRRPPVPRPLGTTGEEGRVQTTDRSLFPSFSDVSQVEVRDAQGRRQGQLDVTPTVELRVTDPRTGTVTAVRRTVDDRQNRFEVTVPR
jgi:hypothetical protein